MHNLSYRSIEPSPFLPQTTIAIEKVKIAANEAQPNVKIMTRNIFLNYNLLETFQNFTSIEIKRN